MFRAVVSCTALTAVLAACSAAEPSAEPSSSSTPTTTTTVTTTAPTAGISPEQVFVQILKDQGFLKSDGQKNLLLMKADIYCRSLQQGMTREQTLSSTGLPGSVARTEAEAILKAAVLTICPDQANAK